MDPLPGIEDLSDVQRHARLLEGTRNLGDLIYDRTAGHPDVDHRLRVHAVADIERGFFQVVIGVLFFQTPDQDNALLIHLGDQIPVVITEQVPDHLHRGVVPLILCFNDVNDTADLGFDVQLLGPVVDIHQQQIVQQQILHEIILVEPLPVRNDQILQLADRNSPDHVDILPGSLCDQDILRNLFSLHLKEMISLELLAVRGRRGKLLRGGDTDLLHPVRGSNHIPIHAPHGKINLRDGLQLVNRRLDRLV